MKPRTQPKRISDKRRKALGDKPIYSTIQQSKPKPLKKRSRSKSEFARIYGSKERVEFVKSLPCAACGVVGYSENAHLLGNGGMSRKADADTTGPLCGTHPYTYGVSAGLDVGCHWLFDVMRSEFRTRFPDFDPEKVAADTETRWLAHSGGKE